MSLETNKFAIATAIAVAAREAAERLKIETEDPELDRKVAEWRGVLEARKYQFERNNEPRI